MSRNAVSPARRMLRWIVPAVIFAACLAAYARQAMNVIPERYAGTWAVVAVRVDGSGVQAYVPDDPALLQMQVRIAERVVEAAGRRCEEPFLTEETVPLHKLLHDTYEATPASMGLGSAQVPDLRVLFVSCPSGGFGPDIERGSWIAQWSPGYLVMSWTDGALLLLKKA